MSNNNTGMTKAEAIEAMQQGKKVTHEFFTNDEWIAMNNGMILSEDGVMREPTMYWEARIISAWEAGWSLYEEREVNHTATIEEFHARMTYAMMKLNEREEHFKKRKAAILARTLEEYGANADVTKQLREKGLPKQIFVSALINSNIVSQLSFFAPVCHHHALENPTVILSWSDRYDIPQLAPNVLLVEHKDFHDAVGI